MEASNIQHTPVHRLRKKKKETRNIKMKTGLKVSMQQNRENHLEINLQNSVEKKQRMESF